MTKYVLLCLLLITPACAMADGAWIMVDTRHARVTVFLNNKSVLHLNGAAIGRGGATELHMQGDRRTPLGVYHVVGINHSSRYHLFFELDYPTPAKAQLAYERGLIDKAALLSIKKAFADGRIPPQDTRLGGNIGIHGVGEGSSWIHRHFNWTDGCIALTDAQIEKLSRWLAIGTRVVIK